MLAAIGSIAFVIARTLPGDPARLLLGPNASPSDVAHARKIYRLDAPLSRQFVSYWGRLLHRGGGAPAEHASCSTVGPLHVDLGYSYRYRMPVTKLIAKKAPASLWLALAALWVQILFGVCVGVFAAMRRGSLLDRGLIGLLLLGISAPTFITGLALQYLFAYRLGWVPYDGYGQAMGDWLAHLVLPALTLGMYGAALYARLSRDEMSRALQTDYVMAARARGASPWRVAWRHALRNAALPIATLMLLELGALVGGAIVTEKLFRWPGMGAMAVDAMVNRDGPVILGTVLFSAAAIVIATLLLDGLAALIDPRLRSRR
jgi:peptide/nickel transport system permease protein